MSSIIVAKVPKLIRDPDTGSLVINSTRGRKMPRGEQLRIIAAMRAERAARPSPVADDLPF